MKIEGTILEHEQQYNTMQYTLYIDSSYRLIPNSTSGNWEKVENFIGLLTFHFAAVVAVLVVVVVVVVTIVFSCRCNKHRPNKTLSFEFNINLTLSISLSIRRSIVRSV